MIPGPLRTPFIATSATKTFNVYGRSFYKINSVYLSGAPYENVTFFNPFSATPRLSANNPGFYGIKLPSTSYTFNNTHTMTFIMPSATQSGFVDIILQNDAGLGKLTDHVFVYKENPYPSGTAWDPYQRPWKDGIKVNRVPI